MGLSIVYFKGSQVGISKLLYDVFISLKMTFTLPNGADPDEMPYLWHFNGFHHLPKCAFSFQYILYTKR